MRSQRGNSPVAILGVVFFIIFVVGLVVFILRWFSAATMNERITEPRPGIECFVVSAHDSVGVACYPTADLPVRK